MSEKKYEILTIAPDFYQLGTPSYPAYLSMGDKGMIIEGGTGATFPIIVEQVKELGIAPERIEYLALTHTHPDHIGAVPHLKKLWPHLKIVAGAVAAELLKKEEVIQNFVKMDHTIAENLLVKGDIDWWPPELDNPVFEVDRVVKEGDKIDLGKGVVWTVYETPGHSPCHISFHNEGGGILVIGDATGIYEPGREVFWPNYFQSLEAYCDSIRKLAALPARIGARSHGGVVEGEPKQYLQRVMKATEDYHRELVDRVEKGEDAEKVVLEKAKWIYTFTNMQPFKLIHVMTGVTLKRSQAVDGRAGLFEIPD
ncbi:MAG: MBL fold metallo-hydrolase [Dehalococcoidia bacterium]|jgi:glyoxylase-like metal-dependent hydrolase (beta-lactamase superfamily II)